MTDDQLIQTMLRDYSEDLTDNQREAFADMEGRALSEKQRQWVHGVAERLGIHVAGAENAFSALPEAVQREHLAAVRTRLPWETGAVARPKKPPGRA